MITSSTSAVLNPCRSCSALSTCANTRCGWTGCSAPFCLPLPLGDRMASMMYASPMGPKLTDAGVNRRVGAHARLVQGVDVGVAEPTETRQHLTGVLTEERGVTGQRR